MPITAGVAWAVASVAYPGERVLGHEEGVFALGNVAGHRVSGEGSQTAGRIVYGGIVGHILPTLRLEGRTLRTGDTVVLATDGPHPHVDASRVRALTVAPAVLTANLRGTDDALVLVAWVGSRPTEDSPG